MQKEREVDSLEMRFGWGRGSPDGANCPRAGKGAVRCRKTGRAPGNRPLNPAPRPGATVRTRDGLGCVALLPRGARGLPRRQGAAHPGGVRAQQDGRPQRVDPRVRGAGQRLEEREEAAAVDREAVLIGSRRSCRRWRLSWACERVKELSPGVVAVYGFSQAFPMDAS